MFLLDTDICIYLINRKEAPRERFRRNAARTGVSAISYAELCFGVAHSARIALNERLLQQFRTDLQILPFDADAATHYGEIRQELGRQGALIGPHDLLIAAHARSRDATLVTNNEREFRRVPGLRTENWLRPERGGPISPDS